MPRPLNLISLAILLMGIRATAQPPAPAPAQLDSGFSATVAPFLQKYCIDCHGKQKTEGDLDLSGYSSLAAATRDSSRWNDIIDKLDAGKMPPKKAKLRPSDDSRRQVAQWFHAALDFQTKQNAGDPGVVPVRRLSNSEYDYTIRDLTRVDMRPAREFPVDPANTAGFDNSGESLSMSPALLAKYLQAARAVADNMVLTPDGFDFAPHPMLVETDRDRYAIGRIVDFYLRQPTDFADYFQAAWTYKNRSVLGKPRATLASTAADAKVSPKYLPMGWDILEGKVDEAGPIAKLWTK